ncbi:MAG TPA: DUF4184 family protein [Verrucomicrobiae bacterium]|jgi:hypothetical protein|nr:DUF4184 family protein [Verrucomicrobiae bacterium]
MPFTLAHPAAVLPFRRFCPRFFSFPALVVGSLCPDVGYCFGTLSVEDFSHSLKGSLEFCLPVGVVMLGFFYGLRVPVVEMLPERHRKNLLPFCQKPIGSPLTVLVSLLVGIWSHLLFDSFTHKHGWLVENLPALQMPVFSAGVHTFRIFNLLWYACSFAGIVWLWLAWEQWRIVSAGQFSQTGSHLKLCRAILAGVLMIPIELTHHLVLRRTGLFLIAGYSILIVIGMVLRMRSKNPAKQLPLNPPKN